jgi:hypothetical protein
MDLCSEYGIKRQFSATMTPQQNRVLERKNMIVQEIARTMLKYSKLGGIFSAHVVHKEIHILKIGMLISSSDKC